MSDLEYDLLDELYFVIHYDDLLVATELDSPEMKRLLKKIYDKGWLRCYSEPDQELEKEEIDLDILAHKYWYLASKEGLKAHNKN